MKVLLTGAEGFVGKYLRQELAHHGYEVIACDRNNPTSDSGEFYQLDLDNFSEVSALLMKAKPDGIFHLAGWSHVGASWESPAKVYQANTINTIHLFQEFSRIAGERGKFFFVSSSDVYGVVPPELIPLKENSPANPVSPYGLSKLHAEQAIKMLSQMKDSCRFQIVRPFNHTGPGQSSNFVCPSFVRQFAEIQSGHRSVLTHGDLSPMREFLDVREVVRAYRQIWEKGESGETYLVTTGNPIRISEILDLLEEIAGISPPRQADPKLSRPVDNPILSGDPGKVFKSTGWRHERPLKETLAELLEETRRLIAT